MRPQLSHSVLNTSQGNSEFIQVLRQLRAGEPLSTFDRFAIKE